MTVPVLSGAHVLLRPPMEADAAARQALGSDPEIHRMFGGNRSELGLITDEDATKWLNGLRAHPYAWVLEFDRHMIGEIRLDRVDPHDRRATLAIGIYDPSAVGHGYGTEATRVLLEYAFGAIGLHRVTLRVLAYNERATRSYIKCGFVIEGRERQSALVDGEWHDDLIMGVLESDFRRRSP